MFVNTSRFTTDPGLPRPAGSTSNSHSFNRRSRHFERYRSAGDAAYKRLGDQKFTKAQHRIAWRVSRYAATAPREFVAETFAGLVAGMAFPPEVIALYHDFGGPPQWSNLNAAPASTYTMSP